MWKNLGEIDRGARLLLGLALLTLTLAGLIGPWGWIGVIPLATGLVAFCPLYRLFGFNTLRAKK